MRLRKYTLDQHLAQAKREALSELRNWLDTELRKEITTAKWDYPTPPQTRDIVASGRLLRSQQVRVDSSGRLTAEWPVPYSSQIHEGGITPWGLRFPGRPWTQRPLAEAPAKFRSLLQPKLQSRP